MRKGRKCPKCGRIENEFTYFCTECGTKTVEYDENQSSSLNRVVFGPEKNKYNDQTDETVVEEREEESDSTTSTTATSVSDLNDGSFKKMIGCIGGVVAAIVFITLISLVINRRGSSENSTISKNEKEEYSVEHEDVSLTYSNEEDEGSNYAEDYVEDCVEDYAEDNSSQYVEEINIPDWYVVNEVAVNGNELCFCRDDGLEMGNGERPLMVEHYVYSDDGGSLCSLKEYIIFQDEAAASLYADELNTYNYDGRNNFGMKEGETYYYNVGNVLVQEFLPQYTQLNVGTLQDEILMYFEYGWTINDVTSDNSDTDLDIEQNASIEEIQDNESFYGIWCGASKEYSEAEEIANKLISYGFKADILVTTDWENLNSEKWYAVSAGKYSSEEDAENILSDVQKIYSSAYIKFSGEHY